MIEFLRPEAWKAGVGWGMPPCAFESKADPSRKIPPPNSEVAHG